MENTASAIISRGELSQNQPSNRDQMRRKQLRVVVDERGFIDQLSIQVESNTAVLIHDSSSLAISETPLDKIVQKDEVKSRFRNV